MKRLQTLQQRKGIALWCGPLGTLVRSIGIRDAQENQRAAILDTRTETKIALFFHINTICPNKSSAKIYELDLTKFEA